MNQNLDPQIQQQLKEDHLVYASNKTSGIFRQKNGKKFTYYSPDGKRITDKKTLIRIDCLKIPSAWKSVWVSPQENSHLQATGVDDKQRTQYIYHTKWTKICQENKFSKMVDFGLSLPKIRQKIKHDLDLQKLEKRKILATVVWLLEHTFIRIGNEEYSKENNSYGLTTLRNKHVKTYGSQVSLQFIGKSGVLHNLVISNPTIVKTIKKCIELPGYELFQFIDDQGDRHVIDSSDVNLFLKDVTKDDFSAKDFRTWGATNLSANEFYKSGPSENKITAQKVIAQTVKHVAKHLNNTVAVCKNYYIHPTVIESYQKNILFPHFLKFADKKIDKNNLSWNEIALINLLKKFP